MKNTLEILLVLEEMTVASQFRSALQTEDSFSIASVISVTDNFLQTAVDCIPGLIIIDQSKLNTLLLDQLALIKREHPIPVVVFTRDDTPESIQIAILSGVSSYISTRPDYSRLPAILHATITRFNEYNALHQELIATKKLLSERKLIEKAKGILMRQSRMDEQTTYKTMRKMSMDRNLKMSELSQTIIAAAELMN